MTKQAPQAKPPHPALTELAKDPPSVVIAMLWQLRHKLQDMAVTITPDQLERLHAALAYNEQKPALHMITSHNALVVTMLDQSGNQIIQSESTEQDQADKERAAQVRNAAQMAESLIADHRAMAARGEVSEALTAELYHALELLAKAARS